MPYCSRCGVEVEPTTETCPLCGTPIQKLDNDQETDQTAVPYQRKYPDKPAKKTPEQIERSNKQKRLLAWEIVSISLGLPLLIILFLNLIISGTLTWSLYPISAIILTWFLTTFPLLFPNKAWIIIIGEVVPIMLFLLIVDVLDNYSIDWYFRLALPIIGLVGIITAAVVIGCVKVKHKGINIPAFTLLGIAAICLGLDLIIMSYIRGQLTVGWSLFVLVPSVSISLLLYYLHYRFIKKAKIKRRLQP
jgi:hypothetical protein